MRWLLLALLTLPAFAQFDNAGGSLWKQCQADSKATRYSAPITNVQRTGATAEVFTISGTNSFAINDRVLVKGTADDSGSFNTPHDATFTSAYTVDELVTAVSGQTVTVTSSTARGTNPFSTTADSGTLVKAEPFVWEDKSVTPNQWWGCTQFENATNWNVNVQYDYALFATGYNSTNFQTVKSAKYASSFGPYTDSNLNFCHDYFSRLHRVFGPSAALGELNNANCYPVVDNAAWGTSNNLPPASDTMPYSYEMQSSLWAIVDLKGDAHVACGLTRCPVKSSFTNLKQSLFSNFTAVLIDDFDPVFYDATNGNIPKLINDATTTLHKNFVNDHHDYLIYMNGEESDTAPCTKQGGEYADELGQGAVTTPKGNVPASDLIGTTGGAVLHTAAGRSQQHYHCGVESFFTQYRISAQDCGHMRTGQSSCTNTLNTDNVTYPDQIYHVKDQLALWLQGTAEQLTGIAASRSGSTVTLTLGTTNVGKDGSHYYNTHDVVTVSGCSDSTFNTVAGTGMTLTGMNQSAGTVTGTLSGAGTSATGCTVDEGPGYSSIASLVSAWGLTVGTYDTFGTDETLTTGESVGTGDGSTVTFTGTLVNHTNYTPGSAQLFIAGVLTCGDSGDGAKAASATTTDHWVCNTNPTAPASNPNGTINTSTGAYTVTVNSAPSNSAAITINYSNGGWGIGKGLKDEAGQNLSCISDLTDLTNTCGGSLKTDLDDWAFYFGKQFYGTLHKFIHNAAPGVMQAPTTPDGGFSLHANPHGLWLLAEYSDLTVPQSIPNLDPFGATSDSQTRADIYSKYLGDMPWINRTGLSHISDSYEGGNATVGDKWHTDGLITGGSGGAPDFFTGQQAGNWLRDTYLPAVLSFTVTCNGACNAKPMIGIAYADNSFFSTSSFWSPYFDLYNGQEAQPNAFTNPRGYLSGCVTTNGCNPNASSDIDSPAANAFSQWLNKIPRTMKVQSGGVTIQ